ncbi:copper resistance CopC/CopD family protein [Cohnella soli]|uniref:Copper resistance CopC/CopD family protein n=1 Tax=Cohnella soli TaxID=425005 RepID=A0ABW0HS81_9BACL
MMTSSERSRSYVGNDFIIKAARLAIALVVICLGVATLSGRAEAHAQLEQTTPVSGAKLETGPASVELRFNERLDSGGMKLSVLNEDKRDISKGKPELFDGNKALRIDLPKLGVGRYTVSYSVISADGHPVSGAYVFTVGNPTSLKDASELDPHSQVGHAHEHGGAGLTQQSFLLYASRIVYYAGLLTVAGLAMWGLRRKMSADATDTYRRTLALAGKFALIATLVYVFFSLQDLGQGEPISEWGRILTETTIGKLYIAELLLALAAPLLPSLAASARLIWPLAALLAEAWSGHAAAYDPVIYTVGLDFAHLAAASLWGGGLLLLLAIWRIDRSEAGRFAMAFSKWAFISFVALWVTGVLSTLDFLPSLEYLKFTLWGKWLIAKVALSVLVAITALLIRQRLRKGDAPRGYLLKIDAGLLASIVLCVGILTYQTPLPDNEPLTYHKMGTEMHVTLRITPNEPGENNFTLKIWLPEKVAKGEPKSVKLRMLPTSKKDVGYIDVPLEKYTDQEQDAYPDFLKTTYRSKGPYLPFAGEWTAQIRVTDGEDNERVLETTYRIY